MPELRRDPVVGYWTIIATERSRRPVEYMPRGITEERICPFCEGRESHTTPEIFAIRKPGTATDAPGWDVRAITSKVPILSPLSASARSQDGIYDSMPGSGTHEILIESPRHTHSLDELSEAQIGKALVMYAERILALEKDGRYKYALLFKNHGLISGVGSDVIRHTRSQLIATPITPKRVKEEMAVSKAYHETTGRCVFCDTLAQESSEKTRVIHDGRFFTAFCPYASRSPFEIWIAPKTHSADFAKEDRARFGELSQIFKQSLSKLRRLLDDPPYNLILHTAPFGHPNAASYHWYFQIAPRLTHDAGFEWGTGIHINPTPPEEAAQILRECDASAA